MLETFMTGTVDLKRLNSGVSADAGPLANYDDLYSDVSCRLEDLGGLQQFMLGGIIIEASHRAFFLDDALPGPVQSGTKNGDVLISDDLYYRVQAEQRRRAFGTLPTFVVLYLKRFIANG